MRQHAFILICLAVSVSIAPGVQEQETPAKLLERAYKAYGGFDNLSKARTVHTMAKGTLFVQKTPVEFSSDGYAQLPDKFKSTLECNINGTRLVQTHLIDGDRIALLVNGAEQKLDQQMQKEAKEEIYVDHVVSLLPLKEEKYQLKSLGESMAGGRALVGIEVSSPGHRTVGLYFDKTTGLLHSSKHQAFDPVTRKEVVQERVFSEYKDFNGIWRPTRLLVLKDGEKFMDFRVTRYQLLSKLDERMFKP